MIQGLHKSSVQIKAIHMELTLRLSFQDPAGLSLHLNHHGIPSHDHVYASRPLRYVLVTNDNHLVSLMNFNEAKEN
jgi:hypothetical protein